ncbi:MAG: cell division protein FtsA [Flavobacteriales bacterium]
MNHKDIAVGLDIGTTKIVAIIAQRSPTGHIKILGIGQVKSTGIKRGLVINVDRTTAEVKSAIQKAESNAGLHVPEVTVGIAGMHIRSVQHYEYITRSDSDSSIKSEDIDLLINGVRKIRMLPGEEILHVLPQEFHVDSDTGIKEPEGMTGSRLGANFHIVVGQIYSIQNLGACVINNTLKLKGITLEPLASAESCLNDEEKEAGVVLLDIGGGTTDLAIFKDGIIRHTAVIPIGGQFVTNDIRRECNIIEKQAELLKIKFGSAWPLQNSEHEIVSIPGLRGRERKEISLRNLSIIIHTRLLEIIDLVCVEIENYEAHGAHEKLIAGVVLTGGGSAIKDLPQLVKYHTGMDARVGTPTDRIDSQSVKKLNHPLYATSIGLALMATEKKYEERLEQERLEHEAQRLATQQLDQASFSTLDQSEPKPNKERLEEQPQSKIKTFFSKLIDFDMDKLKNKIISFVDDEDEN